MPIGGTNQLSVSIGADVRPLGAGLKQATATLGTFTSTTAARMRRFSTTMRNISLGLGTAAFGIGAVLRNTAQGVVDLDRAAQRLGTSAENYQILDASLQSIGGTMQEVARSSRGLQSALVAVRERGDEVRQALFDDLRLEDGFFNLDPVNQWLELTDRLRERFIQIRSLSGLQAAQGDLSRAISLLGVAPLATRRAVVAESREALLQPGTELAAAGGLVSTEFAAQIDRVLTRLESIQAVFAATFTNRLLESFTEGIFGNLDEQERLTRVFEATRNAAEGLADALRTLVATFTEFRGVITTVAALLLGGALLGPLLRVFEVLKGLGFVFVKLLQLIAAGSGRIIGFFERFAAVVARAAQGILAFGQFFVDLSVRMLHFIRRITGNQGLVVTLAKIGFLVGVFADKLRGNLVNALLQVGKELASLILLLRVGLAGGLLLAFLDLVSASEDFWGDITRLFESNINLMRESFQQLIDVIDRTRLAYLKLRQSYSEPLPPVTAGQILSARTRRRRLRQTWRGSAKGLGSSMTLRLGPGRDTMRSRGLGRRERIGRSLSGD